MQGKVVKHLAHHAGRNQGKDSETAHSSRHTLSFLQSEWLQSEVEHPTPGAKRSQNFTNKYKATKKVQNAKWVLEFNLQLLVVAAPTSRSWGDSLVPLQ